jgi:hypothetical protein
MNSLVLSSYLNAADVCQEDVQLKQNTSSYLQSPQMIWHNWAGR